MKKSGLALISGITFGVGLSVSQMVNPAKVQSFLDITGNWDPSLAFVMIGALAVAVIAFRWIMKRPAPVFDSDFSVTTRIDVDRPLLIGAALFGIGWGMTGFCPGPAVAGMGLQMSEAFLMVGSVYIGFLVHRIIAGK